MPGDRAPETIAAANGIAGDNEFGAVVPPLYLSSTFAFEGFEKAGRYDYGRTANPNRDLLSDTLAKLERGAGAVIVSSGMAAIHAAAIEVASGELCRARFGGGSEEVIPKPAYSVAQSKQKQGKYLEAITEIRKQLERFPTDFEGQFLLAQIEAEERERLGQPAPQKFAPHSHQ